MSKKLHPAGGYIPTVPQYPSQATGGAIRPVGPPPVPVESHSTPTYPGSSPYPPQQQQHPPYNYGANISTPRPYPPPNPTPSISTGSQHHVYPPQQQHVYPPMNNSRPVSYGGQPSSSLNTSRPSSPPVPGSTNFGNTPAPLHAPLLSSSYNPRPNFGGGNSNGGKSINI